MLRSILFLLVVFCVTGAFAAESVVVEGDAALTIDRPARLKEVVVLDRGRLSIENLFAADVISLGTKYGKDAFVSRDPHRRMGTDSPYFYRWKITELPVLIMPSYDLSSQVVYVAQGGWQELSYTGYSTESISVVSGFEKTGFGSLSIGGGAYTLSLGSSVSESLSISNLDVRVSVPESRGPSAVVDAPTAARQVIVAGDAHLRVNDLLASRITGLLDNGSMSVKGGLITQYLLADSQSRLDVTGRIWAHSLNFAGRSTTHITGLVVADRTTLYDRAVLDVDRRLKVHDDLSLAGGTLTGTGKVIGDVRNFFGTVSPGDGIGKLRLEGDYRQNSNSRSPGKLEIEIASPSRHDTLVIDGKARLGGELSLSAVDGYKPEVGDRFKIVEATEGLRGRFGGPELWKGHQISLKREGNSLFLEVKEKPGFDVDRTFLFLARTENQRNVASAMRSYLRHDARSVGLERTLSALLYAPYFIEETSLDLSLGNVDLSSLAVSNEPLLPWGRERIRMRGPRSGTDAYRRAILDAITPYSTFSLAETALSLSNSQTSQLENNLISLGGGLSLDHRVSAGVPAIASVTEEADRWSAFAEGSGIFARLPDVGNVQEFDYQTAAATVGGSYLVSDRLRLGLYGGYAGTNADLAAGSALSVNSGRFGGFGVWSPLDLAYVYGSIGGAVHSYEYERKIQFPGFNDTAKSNPTAVELNTLLGAGYDFQLGNLSVGPLGSVQYSYLDIGGFTERNAGPLSMRYRRQREDSLRTTLGGKAAYELPITESVSIEPLVRVAWQHEYLDDPSLSASFNRGASPYFDLTSPSGARDSLLVSAGASLTWSEWLGASAFYTNSTAFDSGYVHAVQAGLRVAW